MFRSHCLFLCLLGIPFVSRFFPNRAVNFIEIRISLIELRVKKGRVRFLLARIRLPYLRWLTTTPRGHQEMNGISLGRLQSWLNLVTILGLISPYLMVHLRQFVVYSPSHEIYIYTLDTIKIFKS